ncbi:hypothetical protein [Saccharibacillus sp. JS10]|uniref:hypothetical protein n=1 Tax=Saccharibacillus sp. JS10 TaxID=2950552 RepID=UPI00210BBFC2|nr:hypothetical protein [Saccharibacillus sp. JS10]MCQ4085867.1 hypothetical protein [Saccharibacillus sp. JS10]
MKQSMRSYWNYRVVKYQAGEGEFVEDVFEVCEVYYTDDKPHSFIKDKNPLNQESVDNIVNVLSRISEAISKPVLVWDEKELVELKD